MLKNDVRYIIKRVVVAVAIAFILFFLKAQGVLAATTLGSTPRYRVIYYTGLATGTSVCTAPTSGQTNQTSLIDFGTGFSHTNSTGCTLIKEVYVNLVTTNTSSQYFLPNITYTLQFTWNFNPRTYYNIPAPTPQIYNGSTYVDSSIVNIQSYSASRKSDNYGYLINIQFSVSSSQRYVQFVFEPTVASNGSYIPRFTGQGINLKDSTFTQTDDPTSIAIQEQNNILKQGFNTISTTINNITNVNDQLYQDQTDDSDPNVDVSGMSGITGILPAGPVDSLISLPLTILNIFIDSTSGTCSPYSFTFVFNQTITLPCFDVFWNQVPTAMMLFLSDLPAVIIFVLWAKSVYKRVEKATTFETDVDDEWGGI